MSIQNGWIEVRKTKRGKQFLLRYRVRDDSRPNGWRTETERLEGCKTRKEAEKEKQRRMLAVNAENELRSGRSKTLSAFMVAEWRDYLVAQEVNDSTCYSWASMLKNHVIPEVGEERIDRISAADISRVLSRLARKSRKYRANLFGLLRLMFDVAMEHGFVSSNPVSTRLHRPKKGTERKEKPTLTVEEIRAVVSATEREYRDLISFVALTGLRIGEVLGLTLDDVDEGQRLITIRRTLWRGRLRSTTKTGTNIQLYMSDPIREIVRRRLQREVGTDLFFCRPDGSPFDQDFLRNKVLYPTMDRAGIRREKRTHGFHIFRHSAGSIVHKETGSMKLAQLQLGHANMATTSTTYVHTDREQLEAAGTALATVLEMLPTNCPPEHAPEYLQ